MKIESKRAVVTGGTRGIGAGIVEALRNSGVNVTVVARHGDDRVRKADITDRAAARSILGDLKPEIVILNAGANPALGPINTLTWEQFSEPWEVDVKGTFTWIQEALNMPLAPGSRVIVVSSGAAVQGSPLSGGYAGSKRTCWLMANYANNAANGMKLGIRFQTIVPRQMMNVGIGVAAGAAYAKKRGISPEEQFAGFGKPLTPRDIGDSIVTMLTDPAHAEAEVRGVKGDLGLHALDG